MDKVNRKLKIDKIIIKSQSERERLFYATSTVAKKAEKLDKDMSQFLESRFNKPPINTDGLSWRKRRKIAKKEKSLTNTRAFEIDYKKLYKFLIVFFSILIVGASASWIYFASLKVNALEYLGAKSEIMYTIDDEFYQKDFMEVETKRFTDKKAKSGNYLRYDIIEIPFANKGKSFNLGELGFKVSVKGRGHLTLTVSLCDSSIVGTDKTVKELLNKDEGYALYENGDERTYELFVNYNFEVLGDNYYLKIEVNESRTSRNIESFCIYSLNFKKR